ncbi:regulatory phage cox family protein [Synergistaceae bacterium OttesenSCG-928-I11]|nr:regulatory phage cox family protein [Synergistaceae bacterium OttesenSCG-928-I11]
MPLLVDVFIEKGQLKVFGEIPISSSHEELESFICEIRSKLLGDEESAEVVQELLLYKKELTEEEAAKYIGKSKSFLRRCRKDGKRNGQQCGPRYTRDTARTIRYPVEELDKWLSGRDLYETTAQEYDYSKDRRQVLHEK